MSSPPGIVTDEDQTNGLGSTRSERHGLALLYDVTSSGTSTAPQSITAQTTSVPHTSHIDSAHLLHDVDNASLSDNTSRARI